jgi:ribosome-associated translation inhibitor RaiA
MDTSPATETLIRERAQKLARFHDRIGACRVVVEAHHRHQRKGRIYHVRIDLTVPGHEIVVGRERDQDHSHEDIKVAVGDAFDAARRRLEDHVRLDDHRGRKEA